MFDRLLLLLLVLLLPIGIVVSRVVTGEFKIGGGGMSTLQEKKIDVLVERLNNQINQPVSVGEQINITGVIYASESGILTVAGVAPKTQAFLWVWTASSKQKKPVKIATASGAQSLWKGPLVFWPKEGGSFATELDVSDMAGIVEVRLEQDSAKSNVRFDLEKNKQL